MAILVRGVIGHVHVSLVDSLALGTTEVLLGVILDDLDDKKGVDSEQMGIGALPSREVGEVRVDVDGVEILEYASFANDALKAVEILGLVSV